MNNQKLVRGILEEKFGMQWGDSGWTEPVEHPGGSYPAMPKTASDLSLIASLLQVDMLHQINETLKTIDNEWMPVDRPPDPHRLCILWHARAGVFYDMGAIDGDGRWYSILEPDLGTISGPHFYFELPPLTDEMMRFMHEWQLEHKEEEESEARLRSKE